MYVIIIIFCLHHKKKGLRWLVFTVRIINASFLIIKKKINFYFYLAPKYPSIYYDQMKKLEKAQVAIVIVFCLLLIERESLHMKINFAISLV